TSATGAALRAYTEALHKQKRQADATPEAPLRPAPALLLAAQAAVSYPGPAPAGGEEEPGRPLQNVLRERARHSILVHRAREHNLKNIDVEVPRNKMTVITGVSGSGKSTLAFDVIFGEGQRRYLESLNAYARQFVQPAARPDVDGIYGIPPTVAIEQ